jgi:hypothetical protein
MPVAAIPAVRPLLTGAQLASRIEDDTPVAILDAQLLQLAEHPQRFDTDSLCELLAVLDQQHRRGHLTPQAFRQLQGRVAPLIVSAGQPPAPARSSPPVLRTVQAPPVVASPPLAPGRVLRGRYELRRMLGEGGMSCVYEAVDRIREGTTNAQARVALKVLRPSLAGRADAVHALHLEFERAQALSHPCIVNVFDLDADGDVHFITMERLEGELLGHAIKRLHPAAARREQAFAILARLGEAVLFAHDAGIVHADIKPGNVMLTHSGELRLFDFGAAWPAQREPWIYEGGERSLQGATPTYASAERLQGAAPTVRDDVYSFSCLAYELLAGVHPYDRQPAHEAERNRLRPRRVSGLTRRQWRALRRGLAFRRDNRWPDMRSYLAQLLPAKVRRASMPPVLEPAPPLRAARLSGLWMLALGAAAFAIAYYSGSGLPPQLNAAVEWAASLVR